MEGLAKESRTLECVVEGRRTHPKAPKSKWGQAMGASLALVGEDVTGRTKHTHDGRMRGLKVGPFQVRRAFGRLPHKRAMQDATQLPCSAM
jgi:hypothetical protein